MNDRLVNAARDDDDVQYEAGLRPRTLDEYIGQDRVREKLQVVDRRGEAARRGARSRAALRPARARQDDAGDASSPTSSACAIRPTAGPVIEKPGDLAAMLTNLQAREVLFIDEIHRMSPAIEEILYPAMEDYELDIIIGQGPSARSVKVPVQHFTLIGATTRTGLLTSPLRARFGIVHRLDFYSDDDIREIVHPVGADPRRADRPGRGAARSRGARAARRASPTGCCAASATTRRCAPTARSRSDVARKRADSCSKWTSTASTKSIAGCCARSSRSSAAARSASPAWPRR